MIRTEHQIFTLVEKTTVALGACGYGSERSNHDAFQCLYATRLILDTLSNKTLVPDLMGFFDEADEALTRLTHSLALHTDNWEEVNHLIDRIEQLKLSLKAAYNQN